jgi:hypothetical protein
MTLATFNHYVDRATAGSRTAPSSGRPGARHAGHRELALITLVKLASGTLLQGKHAKEKSRHGKK